MARVLKVGILTLSDKGSRGEREDTAGPAIAEVLEPLSPEFVQKAIISDDPAGIAQTLREWVDEAEVNLIVTTGGTGLGPRDNTPEATREIIEREVPGMAELMRQAGLQHTPMAALSRGIVGVAGTTLIVNLPGSERGVRQNLEALMPVLAHAVELIAGDTEH
jgi:molybdenum cofactor synthesis domain-containing protein